MSRYQPALACLLTASLAAGACSDEDAGQAQVVNVTPIYRDLPAAPAQCGGNSGEAGAAAPCPADAATAGQRQPDGFEVAYRYRGLLYHTHLDFRPGQYLPVNAHGLHQQ